VRIRWRHVRRAAAAALALAAFPAWPSAASPGAADARAGAIIIGLLVPGSGLGAPEGRQVRRGAEIAAARANREGGVGGRPLRLVASGAERPWHAATGALVRLIYDEGAVAIVGALDARTGHVAEQVITRARGQAVFVTPWASEPALTRIRVPWFFSVVPDDVRQAEALVEEIFRAPRAGRVAAWVEDTLDARAAAEAFSRAAPAGTAAVFDADRAGSAEDLSERIGRGEITALVPFASPEAAADLVLRLRRGGRQVDLFAPLGLAVAGFLDRAGEAAEGARIVRPSSPGSAEAEIFRREFAAAYGSSPEAPALYGHDAVKILAEALRRLGTDDPRRLAEVLARTSVEGATGAVRFDERRGREGAVALGVVRPERPAPAGGTARSRGGAVDP